MLKVRKTSWHYRLWRLGRENPRSQPKNLCQYFWHIALLKVLLPATLASFVLLGVGALIWVIWGHPLATGLIVLSALVAIAIGVGAVVLIRKAVEAHQARSYKRKITRAPRPPKEPSLFWAMVKARKAKMCPLIEVIDEQGEQ